MNDTQINKLAKMLNDAFDYADKHEIFVVITPSGVEIEGRHAVDLPTVYTTVKGDNE